MLSFVATSGGISVLRDLVPRRDADRSRRSSTIRAGRRASRAQQFRHITLPRLYHIIGVVVLLTTIWTANAFEPVYLLTGAAPRTRRCLHRCWCTEGMMNLRLARRRRSPRSSCPCDRLVLAVTILLQRKANA